MIESLQQKVQAALHKQHSLVICGSGSKSFFSPPENGDPVSTLSLDQIIAYEPSELYITAQAGTRLQTIEDELAKHQQMLAFEPPHFGPNATLGGAIACGLNGPRRPYCGAVRDALLGLHLINGYGEHLRFGGQVMKNVAGYDVSRLMAGAMGTLGIITQATLKVVPRSKLETTCAFRYTPQEALSQCNQWSKQHWPISASYYHAGRLYIRLSGTHDSIRTAQQQLGGTEISQSAQFWKSVREQQHAFFQQNLPLWRIALPRNTQWLDLPGESAFEWNGGLRWLFSEIDANQLRRKITPHHGHATLFKNADSSMQASERYARVDEALQPLHQRIKDAFDPKRIFNPQRTIHWLS